MARKKVPEWVEELLLPRLNELEGRIKALESKCEHAAATGGGEVGERIESLAKDTGHEFESVRTEFGGLRNEIVSFRNESLSKFDTVDARIAGVRNELITRLEALDLRFQSLNSRLDSLDERIAVMEKIAEFDARLEALESEGKSKSKEEETD